MRQVSDAFAAEVGRSHRAVTRVRVADADGTVLATLEPHAGAVTIDRTRDVRRTVVAQLADPTGELTPTDAHDLLAPFGHELHVERGVVLGDGTQELVPLGVFRLTDFTVADGAEGLTIDLEGSDRSLVVARNRWVDPYTVAAGAATEQAIVDLLTDRFPGVETNLPVFGTTAPLLVLDAGADSNPWRDARELARGSGYELSFDGDGAVVAVVPPSVSAGAPDATYLDGDQAVLLELSRNVSTAASVYNGVVATGEGTGLDAPVRAEAWDEDPGSPTYRHGAFGQVPFFYASPLLKTVAQAQAAADSRLASILGASEQVEWGQVVDPAHDAGDVVEVTRTRAGLSAVRVILDVVNIPLAAAEQMTATGRRRFL